MLLYCFTSARIGEVHELTARRHGAREIGEDGEDTDLEARVIATYYKVCLDKEEEANT
jgi:carbonic anhydrase